MKVGDFVYTPRFCTVKIKEVYTDESQALKDGYLEPTYYKDSQYKIYGKHIGTNTMDFAAIQI
jgi:hypothetical protein